ncbi:MAG: hypothetical protein VB078_10815 [Clostridiaceae bacterium]|nr:hypothetical protein [Clostridiaceae bacterium]
MRNGVASSEGWVTYADEEYEKTFNLERHVDYLKIIWTSDVAVNGHIYLYLNDDPNPIFIDNYDIVYSSIGQTFSFIINEIQVSKFTLRFPEANTNRNVNYYGYY